MSILFISDIHLDQSYPVITEQFLHLLRTEAPQAEQFYILGDLFEVWVGDDDDDPHNSNILQQLLNLSQGGTQCYFMRGNRDFIAGPGFAERTGFTVLEDPHPVELFGQKVLLSHGDQYCTDDVEYQAFRKQARDPNWQQQMLALPLEQRRQIALALKQQSNASTAEKDMRIMDVNQGAIDQALRESGADVLLHGHTHRPGVHRIALDGANKTRIVLGDWYEQASLLWWNEGGPSLSCRAR
ncbi:MAG: UDP-2,3-diacylglucosamine diphosphatase [Pseudomonadota bacterium]